MNEDYQPHPMVKRLRRVDTSLAFGDAIDLIMEAADEIERQHENNLRLGRMCERQKESITAMDAQIRRMKEQ